MPKPRMRLARVARALWALPAAGLSPTGTPGRPWQKFGNYAPGWRQPSGTSPIRTARQRPAPPSRCRGRGAPPVDDGAGRPAHGTACCTCTSASTALTIVVAMAAGIIMGNSRGGPTMTGRSRLPGGTPSSTKGCASQLRSRSRSPAPAALPASRIGARWKPGDPVRWKGYAGQFLQVANDDGMVGICCIGGKGRAARRLRPAQAARPKIWCTKARCAGMSPLGTARTCPLASIAIASIPASVRFAVQKP